MTIALDIPYELEDMLSIRAKQAGVSLQEYLLHVLSASMVSSNGTPVEKPKTESEQSLMARLRKIKISASPDFSTKVDLYEPEGRHAG